MLGNQGSWLLDGQDRSEDLAVQDHEGLQTSRKMQLLRMMFASHDWQSHSDMWELVDTRCRGFAEREDKTEDLGDGEICSWLAAGKQRG